MSNEFISDMDLERRLQGMDDRQLMEFVARQCYDINAVVTKHGKRIATLETRSQKMNRIMGGIGTIIGGAVVAIVNYFTGR